jgi:uncharacterized protein (UPF0332 family)
MKELIAYRLNKAKETLKDAKILFEAGSLFSAVNRLYYAMFYSVTALLLKKGVSSPKHSGIMALFNVNYIKTGVIPKEYGRFYSRLFEFRQKGDYIDFVEFERAKVKGWLKQAAVFIKIIEKTIGK